MEVFFLFFEEIEFEFVVSGIKEFSNLMLDFGASVVSGDTIEEDTDEVENFFEEYSDDKGDNEVSEFEAREGNNSCGGSLFEINISFTFAVSVLEKHFSKQYSSSKANSFP
ncbi:unnamed protein product [[Candida] boidinii]|nr:unnamed protein product [[Candida] boidinii]